MGTENTRTGPQRWSALSCCRGFGVSARVLMGAATRPQRRRVQDPKDRAGRKRKVNRKTMRFCVVACATKRERGAEAASTGAHLNRRRRNLSGPGSLESLLEGGDGAARLGESDAQMLEGLKQRIGTLAVGRASDPGQSRSQNGQTAPEPLDQVIEGIQRQRCRYRLP